MSPARLRFRSLLGIHSLAASAAGLLMLFHHLEGAAQAAALVALAVAWVPVGYVGISASAE